MNKLEAKRAKKAAYMRAYYAANRERLTERERGYYAASADCRREKKRQARAANPERAAMANRLYRLRRKFRDAGVPVPVDLIPGWRKAA